MTHFQKLCLLLLTLFSFTTSLATFADDKIPDKPVQTSFKSFIDGNLGKVVYVINYRNFPHWHTYWKNPGDAGLPTKIEILNEEVTIDEYEWPVPTRYIEEGDLLAYGYTGDYSRFFSLKNLEKGKAPKELKIKSTWLVCKHICIPGSVEFSAQLDPEGQVISSTTNDFTLSNDEILKRFKDLPKTRNWPSSLDIVMKKGAEGQSLDLYYNYTNQGGKDLFHQLGLLTPFRTELLDVKREKLYKNNAGTFFGKLSIGWDGEYAEPEVPFPADGSFEKPIVMTFLFQDPQNESFSIIKKEFTSFDINPGTTIDSLMQTMHFINPKGGAEEPKEQGELHILKNQAPTSESGSTSIWGILFFAFIGGLILNIMPCVLPVISLKLFGLVSHSDESRASILRHNIFYTLGVLFTFLILAATILILKSTGENVGWGFQLQSPVFVALMIIFLFIFSLNLFGLFEFMTPGGKTLGNVELKRGVIGDFVGGILATILSTPCSAPFLGTALTFAFSSSPVTIILIFQAIGVGLAFPFLMTGIFPSTIKLLPKPGMWMEHVKKFLGLTLILTTLWLIDVFLALTNGNLPLLFLMSGLIFIFFAFYFQKNISKSKLWKLIFFVIPLLLFAKLFFSPLLKTSDTAVLGGSDLINEKNYDGKMHWEKWSEKRMAELAQEGTPVFIDFTAKWCFTCKVNEKLVIDTSDFRELISKNGVKLLLGDWTKYDPVIRDYLKKNGHVGVPAYFIQKADGTLVKLGETISISEIKENL